MKQDTFQKNLALAAKYLAKVLALVLTGFMRMGRATVRYIARLPQKYLLAIAGVILLAILALGLVWAWQAFEPVRLVGYIILIVLPLLLCVAYLTFAERKIIGYMQVRMGPNRVGPKGWLQPIADVLKLMLKEIIIPAGANRFLFLIAPVLSIGPALAAWAVIPFADGMVLADLNAGLLYLLALTSLGVYGVIIAGWASNSKYAFLGAMRSAAQIVAYEIAMGFALVGVLMAAGSLNLGDIVRAQDGHFFNWFWLPLLPLFIVYFISGVAETNRAPFDVAEGESEIVAGFHVEYSGTTFAVFFLAEYANMILISALASVMFLGGWLSPFAGIPVLGAPGLHWLLIKTAFFLFFFLWFRATFPRYRYDQIMRLGWKVFIPITIVWIFVLGIGIVTHTSPGFEIGVLALAALVGIIAKLTQNLKRVKNFEVQS